MYRIEEIKSRDNSKIKLLRKLSQKKYREKMGLFVVENLKTIEDGGVAPEAIFSVDKKLLNKIDAREKFFISFEINKSVSVLDSPSGVLALYKKKTSELDFKKSVVYLNGISDPGNLGTILRSALAFGYKNIVLDEKCVDLYNPKVISSAKDAIFKLNLVQDKGLRVLREIKKGMKVFSTNLGGGKSPDSIKVKKLCLVLGSEAHGVDKKILSLSDGFIKIDMKGDMESLNVAVSAGILFYELSK